MSKKKRYEQLTREDVARGLHKLLGCEMFSSCGDVYEDCNECPYNNKFNKIDIYKAAIRFITHEEIE